MAARAIRVSRSNMKPTIGRIVHFVLDPTKSPIAAIIVAVWTDTCVNLRIFQDGSNTQPNQWDEWQTSKTFDDSVTPASGTWHWPPKV